MFVAWNVNILWMCFLNFVSYKHLFLETILKCFIRSLLVQCNTLEGAFYICKPVKKLKLYVLLHIFVSCVCVCVFLIIIMYDSSAHTFCFTLQKNCKMKQPQKIQVGLK